MTKPLLHAALLPLLSLACRAPEPAAASSAEPGRADAAALAVATPIPTSAPTRAPSRASDDPLVGAEDPAPFFPGATHDPAVLHPDETLGQPLGTRLASHGEVLQTWETWARQSPRVELADYGRTYEGRRLVVAYVTSPANHARMEAIRAAIGRLADPTGLDEAEAARLIETTPAVAWMGYSIHGDETSGVDGGLAFAHHLIAATDADVERLLERVVVVIDPCMNPDGRERVRSMIVQTGSRVPNLDTDSLHRGRWPFGRGNHYLFDMNRDWMAGVSPESRGRWDVLRELPPQLFVDAHEMGALDTFLFYPQAEPRNPYLPATLPVWQKVLGDAQGAAFDAYGWSYYSREWADAWAPFYSDAWGSLSGAIGMLYEQASFGGQPIRRASGEVATYREAVWHQAVASLASVTALADHRAEILADFAAFRRASLDPKGKPAFVFVPGRHPDREAWLVETLVRQGIRVQRAPETLALTDARHVRGELVEEQELPPGALVVRAAQAAGSLAQAFLDLDTRVPDAVLVEEREELERTGNSTMYDVTSWDLGHALDLDGWWIDGAALAGARLEPVEALHLPPAGVVPPADAAAPVYGWVVDGRDDRAVIFATRALEAGLAVQCADEPFESAGRAFARGSLLVRRHENGDDVAERVARAASESGVQAIATGTARAPGEGHDLGGQHFHLLARPRVAMVSGAPTSVSDFGHLWHALDRELGLPVTLLEATSLSRYDLRRYNVLVVPPAWGDLGGQLAPLAADLRAWVRSGGTLIAVGSSAGTLAREDLGLSGVRRLRDALEDVEAFRLAARRELAAREVSVDPASVWDGAAAEAPPDAEEEEDDEPVRADLDAEREDRWRRRFMPTGVTLLAHVDEDAWITGGCDSELPVFFSGSQVLLAREPARTPVRLAGAEDLRLSGILWPEARERLAESAWLTVESRGHGQVILFAARPGFRGYHRATARLFKNAVVLGPGMGARPPRGW